MAVPFWAVHRKVRAGEARELVLKGGRGSGKSSYAALEGVLTMLRHPQMHGVVMRKVGSTIRASVFGQYLWAIEALGLLPLFRAQLAPMELCYSPTGQKLLFFGADDAGKLKSLKPAFGYVGFLHLEEFDQFEGEGEVRNIEQAVLRGGEATYEIKTFNPPRSKQHWVNRYCEAEKPGQLIHHSTYEAMPEGWLGRRFLADAAHLKERDFGAYEHEYLGIANGVGGEVFRNLVLRAIDEKEIAALERTYHGVDFGYHPDPWAYVGCKYDAARQRLYVFREAVAFRCSNGATGEMLGNMEIGEGERVVCDSAEPKSIADYRGMGIRAVGAHKGPGSLAYGMKWLAGLSEIVIDPKRCPEAAREFRDYAYEGAGGGYPDSGNHCIDAVRYAVSPIFLRNGTGEDSALTRG